MTPITGRSGAEHTIELVKNHGRHNRLYAQMAAAIPLTLVDVNEEKRRRKHHCRFCPLATRSCWCYYCVAEIVSSTNYVLDTKRTQLFDTWRKRRLLVGQQDGPRKRKICRYAHGLCAKAAV